METEFDNKTMSFSASRLAFRERYLKRLIPLLSCIHKKSTHYPLRFCAVKKAVDLSLVCSAGNSSWSQALLRKLHHQARAEKQKKQTILTTHVKRNSSILHRLRRRRHFLAKTQQPKYRQALQIAHGTQITQSGNFEASASPYAVTQSGKFPVTSKSSVATQYGNFDNSKLSSFRGLIPGGHHMDLPDLLDQAAHYIISLQLQVDSLAFLSHAVSS